MKMFLKRVVLTNIRCLEHLDLSFQVERSEIPSIGKESGALRQWTLILGENGAGKSTILQSKSEEQRLKRLREALADLPDWSIESPVERRQRELLEKIS